MLNHISTTNIQGDLVGGVKAAILPLLLAFGVSSGAGAAAGLWGAVLMGLFAALFGGTPTLISEPTGPMTVVITAVIANLTARDLENGLALAFTVGMLAGIFQILFGLWKLGPFRGQAIPKGGDGHPDCFAPADRPGDRHGAEGIRRISEIASGFPNPQVPTFAPAQLQTMVVSAAVLGMLGCMDALLTAVIANILTIDKMSALQSKAVKSLSTGDGDLMIPDEEKELLDQGKGQVLLFQLNGAMIFSVEKAIAYEHNAIRDCKAVIFDLSEVSHLGVTAALAVGNVVVEAIAKGRQVFVVGAVDTTRRRLETFGLFEKLPSDRATMSRREALQQAVAALA